MKKNGIFYEAGIGTWKRRTVCTGFSAMLLLASLPVIATSSTAVSPDILRETGIAQQSNVNGVVCDENGEALIGASVMVK